METEKIKQESALELFHPLVRRWFLEQVGTPTEIQEMAWPEIAKGDHVLVVAPTGSGKTLTAFLWAIDNFLKDKSGAKNSKRVLYISPLKALNNDIQRNLEKPLQELQAVFRAHGKVFPQIRTAVRSGDTDPVERRAAMRHPPEIFITTPESLNVLLNSHGGHRVLAGISTVILDEIHAVLPSKRGTYLISAVERLVPLCGEFQRIAISATVNPLKTAADFIAGYRLEKFGGDFSYKKRRVTVVKSDMEKKYTLAVKSPIKKDVGAKREEWWPALTEEFRQIIAQNRSTLFFANSRRMVEKITRFINEGESADRVYSHHGSLAKEIRQAVEKRFKDGELAAIIATSSLELGIDIGAVDQVVLVESPHSIAASVQRIGRSGHGVGQVSRGLFYPLHSRSFLDAAVIAANIDSAEIEPISPVENPLDVLAQLVLSMTLLEKRDLNELYAEIRACFSFHDLKRKDFDLVVEMLAGRYADSRIRELKPRLLVDRLENSARARENAASLLFLSGGVIPDRGYYNMRVADSKAKIGELDEEFVWERAVGDAFPFGNQVWRIQRITPNDVEVVQITKSNALVPFWRAEEMNRSFHLSEKIAYFLKEADEEIDTPGFRDKLLNLCHLSEEAADELIYYLQRQKEATGTALPHRHHLLVEHFRSAAGGSDGKQTVLHTFWGGRLNRPFAFALAAAWEEKYKYPLEIFVNNDCIMLNLPHEFTAREIIELAKPSRLRRLLRSKLESTGYFGARFRENAQCALLLPRQSFHRRMPLWFNRLRSKKLLEATAQYEDFPILVETWRQCMEREFEIDMLIQLLMEISAGEIEVSEVISEQPSPFTDGVIWRQTNVLMYEDDSPAGRLRSGLSDELIKEVIYSTNLRPRFPEELILDLQRKLQRVEPGYSPGTAQELLFWVKERLYIPYDEWVELLSAVERDHGLNASDIVNEIKQKLLWGPAARAPSKSQPGGNETKQKLSQGVKGGPAARAPSKSQPGGNETKQKLSQGVKGGGFLETSPPCHGAVIALENLPRIRAALGLSGAVDEQAETNGVLAGGQEEVSAGFLDEWLRFYGPVSREFIQANLGIDESLLSAVLDDLIEDGRVIADEFRQPQVEDQPAPEELCNAENVEILLRMRRKRQRPDFEALEIDALPLFLAVFQRLVPVGDDVEDLQNCLENLLGYPARAALWEGDILPARLNPYYTDWLDTVMRENRLIWFGSGKEKLGFCFDTDYELFAQAQGELEEQQEQEKQQVGDGAPTQAAVETAAQILAGTKGKMDFASLQEASLLSPQELTAALWEMAWQGRITNDDFQAIRTGIMNRFQAQELPTPAMPRRRLSFSRWKSSRDLAGNWYELRAATEATDALDFHELVKDRIRQLFMRWGVLFRELLWNEMPALRWGNIFPVLRLMELSGEIFSGHFFKGIPGLQFCTPQAFRILSRGLPEDAVYWMNAADPASLCGIGIDELRAALPLPHRLNTTHLVFHGKKNVLISKKNGKELEIKAAVDDPRIPGYLEFFKTLLSRKFQPMKFIKIETINDKPALDSPYKKVLLDFGFYQDYRALTLEKSY